MPKISVLMAVHNGMPFLPKSVESILAQTFSDWELILADDGSTDQTPQYAQSLADPRIRYFPLGRVGLVETRRFTVRMAQAPLLAVLDADDIALPERLHRQYLFLQKNPSCVLLGSQVEEIDAEDRPIGRREFPLTDQALRWRLFLGSPFIHSSTLTRREAVLASGSYPPLPQAEDYGLMTRLAEQGTLANLPECLVRYRVHPGMETATQLETQIQLSANVAAQYAVREIPGIDPAAVRDLYFFLCTDRDAQETSAHQMAEAYRKIKAGYLAKVDSPSEELQAEIARAQQVLRWRCLERAQAVWHRPWRAWQWLRLAGRFDPEQGTLGQIALRALRKLLPK